MKSTGIVRKLDQLGRVVLPIELRRTLEIEIGDGLEIFTEEKSIILRKHEPGCIFCGNARNITYLKGKCICRSCKEELKNESF